jgi:hypothetical protein
MLSSVTFAQRGSKSIDKKREIGRTAFDSIMTMIDSVKETLPSIEIAFEGANKAVFWGRTFGLNQYSIEPSLVFNTGKGLYFYNTNYYWSKDVTPNLIAKSDFGIGYEKDFTENFTASLSYEKWLYYNGDTYVKHALQNSIESQATYDFDWFNLGASAFDMFGNINVFETDFMISQEFFICSFSKYNALYFFPEFTSIFANKNFLPIYGDIPPSYLNNNKFRLIDLELNLPLRIQLKNFEVQPAFHYNIPIKEPNETVHPFNYFSVRVAYNFYFDKQKKLKKMYEKLLIK